MKNYFSFLTYRNRKKITVARKSAKGGEVKEGECREGNLGAGEMADLRVF